MQIRDEVTLEPPFTRLALDIVRKLNVPVFSCASPGMKTIKAKTPLTEHGFHHATTDEPRIPLGGQVAWRTGYDADGRE